MAEKAVAMSHARLRRIPSEFNPALVTVALFCSTLLMAGHGIGPVALLLVLGWESWFWPVLVGWFGIANLMASGYRIGGPPTLRPLLGLIGAASLLVSFLLFIRLSEIWGNSVWGLPFLVALVVNIVRLVRLVGTVRAAS